MVDWFNKYRFFPRLFALFYLYWMSRVIDWAMTLDNPSEAQVLVAAVTVPAAAFFKFYVDSGPADRNPGEKGE